MPAASTSTDLRRRAAVILARVEARGAHAARLLGDAAPFLREVVLGVLRWQLVLDMLLERHVRQPFLTLDAEVRAVLRVGLYEAARLRTPLPVAVAEAVRVAKSVAPRASGLVNAVLRQAVREPWPAQDGSEPLWLRFSHPRWLVERWTTLLGEDVVASLLASDQEAAPLALLTAVTSADALTAGGCTLRPHPYVPGVAVVTGAAHVAAALLGQGRGYAMDPHAVVVARSLPDISGTVLDLAAAPGGKSLVLACERPELRLVALDRHPGRAAAMRRTLGRLAGRTGVAVADAARPPLREGRFGAVLLDAPCSGTGTLRRHPEIRWRLQPRDLIALTELQCALAAAAARLVEPGGVLLYSTCSLEPEENARVVETLGLEPMSPPPEALAGVPHAILSSGGVMLLPGAWGDGFTVHLLRRGERLVTRGRFA